MRKLRINWRDFETAADSFGGEFAHYLDLDTAAVLSVSRETREYLEELTSDAEADDPIEELIAAASVPDWQKQALRDAWRIEQEASSRMLALDDSLFQDEYADLADFTRTVTDTALRREIETAIEGGGAFRRFRNVIHGTFRERKQWFAFRDKRRQERATAWLLSMNVAVEWIMPPPPPVETTGPSAREHLLQGVVKFVVRASALDGVKRIALLGSLTRDEPDPKDADVLVTVGDAMDLAPLAKAGRQLSGHAQQKGRGADVFLANERGEYIGRTCHWSDCRPFIRVSCDALHCGRRPYLHDDFESVRLEQNLVISPPIVLWPTLQSRVAVPSDVETVLLSRLRS